MVWRNGVMPYKHSPLANGRGQGISHPRQAGIIVMHGHVFEPKEMHVFDTLADIDGLIHRPALIDVAHEVDIRPHRCAGQARALGFLRRRYVTGQRHLGFHLLETALDQCPTSFKQMIQRIAAHQRAAGVGRHALAQAAKHGAKGLAENFAFDIP